ncbi:MAG: DUF488 domain-containing protein [Alphaproteobacteria bacterium]|nr:DUF488 domain-containing protein [Alphaproteobacteria bacterium]
MHTIGFTQTTAENFFLRLLEAKTKHVIDVRLNNKSQLAGFAKSRDLKYFLDSIGGIKYIHEPLLAPTQEIFTKYKKEKGEWSIFESQFIELMDRRKIDKEFSPDFFEDGCLLCSEKTHHHCHRRLITEFLTERWNVPISIKHL